MQQGEAYNLYKEMGFQPKTGQIWVVCCGHIFATVRFLSCIVREENHREASKLPRILNDVMNPNFYILFIFFTKKVPAETVHVSSKNVFISQSSAHFDLFFGSMACGLTQQAKGNRLKS